jgi:hypothetical protein
VDGGSIVDVSELCTALILITEMSRVGVHGNVGFSLNPSGHSPMGLLNQSLYIYIVYAHTLTHIHFGHFEPEDGGSVYLRNVENIAHIQTVERPKIRSIVYIFVLLLYSDLLNFGYTNDQLTND